MWCKSSATGPPGTTTNGHVRWHQLSRLSETRLTGGAPTEIEQTQPVRTEYISSSWLPLAAAVSPLSAARSFETLRATAGTFHLRHNGSANNPRLHTVCTCMTSFSKVLCMNRNHEACRGQDDSSVAVETDHSSRSAGTSGFLCK